MRIRNYLIGRLLPWLAWMGLIFFFSSRTGDQVGAWINALVRPILPTMSVDAGLVRFSVQKMGHFLEYAALGILAFRATQPLWPRLANGLAFAMSAVYAMSDEWHQSFVPGRGPSWRDVGIDSLGVLFGLLLLQCFLQFRQRRDTLPVKPGLIK